MNEEKERLLYSVKEAMWLLNMSRSVLYEEIRSGRLESCPRGGRRFFTQEQLEQYVARLLGKEVEHGEAA